MQYNNKFRKMKHLIKKITLIILMSLFVGILVSFSFISEREEAISRNVEVLSRGEGSSTSPCVFGEGICHYNGYTYYGMIIKK